MSDEMLDTSPHAKRFHYERLARLTSSERLALMRESSRMVRMVAESAIRSQYPNASDEEVLARLAVRLYGRDVVERVLPDLPADAR